MGRILGLDYGLRRLGFALTDPDQIIASTLCVEVCRDESDALRHVQRVLEETGAETLVIGLPLNMNGSTGPIAHQVMEFKEKLGAAVEVPIELWDERMTTQTAENVLIEAGTRRKKRKGLVDKLAAQIMLQHYLDAKEMGNG